MVTMKLTCKKLLAAGKWSTWQKLEWKQLDQYKAQKMFRKTTKVYSDKLVFNSYPVKSELGS